MPALPTTPLPTPLPTPGPTVTPTAVDPLRQARAWTVEVLRLVALRTVAGTTPTAGRDPGDDVGQALAGSVARGAHPRPAPGAGPVWREPGDPVLPGVLYVPLAAQFAARRAAGGNPFTVLPSPDGAAAS